MRDKKLKFKFLGNQKSKINHKNISTSWTSEPTVKQFGNRKITKIFFKLLKRLFKKYNNDIIFNQ